jgi:hypothetical protein
MTANAATRAPAHGRAHTALFLESLCGPNWPQLIPHPHRQEIRP